MKISQSAIDAAKYELGASVSNFDINVLDRVLQAAAPHIISDNVGALPEGVRWHTGDYWDEGGVTDNLYDLLGGLDDFEVFEGKKPTQTTDVFAFRHEDEYYEFTTKKEALVKIAELKALGEQDETVI
jgi:hypothetical protein